MPIVKSDGWRKCEDSNKDPYGKCCVDVAREVMRMLDENEDKPIVPNYDEYSPHWYICQADDKIEAGGITGFMAGCVASMVSAVHSRGEEFRKMWNRNYIKDEDDKGGVVNPAIMTLRKKDE